MLLAISLVLGFCSTLCLVLMRWIMLLGCLLLFVYRCTTRIFLESCSLPIPFWVALTWFCKYTILYPCQTKSSIQLIKDLKWHNDNRKIKLYFKKKSRSYIWKNKKGIMFIASWILCRFVFMIEPNHKACVNYSSWTLVPYHGPYNINDNSQPLSFSSYHVILP